MNIPNGRPPWLENVKNPERQIRDTWKRSDGLQNAIVDEFIKDTLHAEIVGIVSSTLTVKLPKRPLVYNFSRRIKIMAKKLYTLQSIIHYINTKFNFV